MSKSSGSWFGSSYPLRVHLLALALAAGVPIAILAGLLLVRSANFERTTLESQLVQVANDVAEDLDRDLDRNFTILRTLSALPSLTSEDWPIFYEQAKAAIAGKGYVIVIDDSLRQLVNTLVPYGKAPRTTGDPETARRMLETKQPTVSNLFFSLIDGSPVLNVNVPVVRDGKVRFILIFGQKAEDLVPLLQQQNLGPEWITAVLDRKGVLVARSRSNERFVGKKYAVFDADLVAPDHTIRRTKSLDGDEILRVIVHSKLSGWLVTASIPIEVAEGPLRSSLWWWGIMTIAAVVVATTLAWWLARSMASALTAAEDAAIALGKEEAIAPLNSSLSEANTIVAAQGRAQAQLLARSEHQRVLMHELSHRVKNMLAVVQSMTMRTFTDERPIGEARTIFTARLLALSRAQDVLMKTDWQGAKLADIISAELAPFSTRVAMEGPELIVQGRMVQTFALLLHELATNAAKHGSLSIAQGSIAIRWSVTGSGKGARFHFTWQEKDGPPVKPPVSRGFGTALLERAFPADLDVKPRLAYEPDGFVFEIDVPFDAVAQHS